MSSPRDWTELHNLFGLYLRSDPAATRRLFSQIQEALEGFYWQRTGDSQTAEDLAQAAMLKIHLSRDRFDHSKSLKAWVFSIACNCLIDHWRGTSAKDEAAPALHEDLLQIPTEELATDLRFELRHDLEKSLKTLKPIERQIVYLYGVEGLSMAEIGQVLGLTESAVKLRAFRSYKALREEMGALLQILLMFGGLRWMR